MTKRQKNILFWILQIFGWALYGIAYFLLMRKSVEKSNFISNMLFLFTYMVGFGITVTLR